MDATNEDTLKYVMDGQVPDWALESDCEPDYVASANASTTITPKGDDKSVNLVARTIPDFSVTYLIGYRLIVGGVQMGQLCEAIQWYLENPTYPLDVEKFSPLKGRWTLKGYQPQYAINAALMRLQLYYCESESLGGLFAVEVHRLNGDASVAFNTFTALRSKCLSIQNAMEYSRDDLTQVAPREDPEPRWMTPPPLTKEAKERLNSFVSQPPQQEHADFIQRILTEDYYQAVSAGASICASALLEDTDALGQLIGQASTFRVRLFELLGNQWDCVDIKRCAAIALREIIPWLQASDLMGQGQSHPFHQLILGQNRADMFTRRVCQEILERVPELNHHTITEPTTTTAMPIHEEKNIDI